MPSHPLSPPSIPFGRCTPEQMEASNGACEWGDAGSTRPCNGTRRQKTQSWSTCHVDTTKPSKGPIRWLA